MSEKFLSVKDLNVHYITSEADVWAVKGAARQKTASSNIRVLK